MAEQTTQEAIEQRIKENLTQIHNRLMVFSGKGGVGKTTVAVNLALALAQKNLRVGILDVDIHGPNVPRMVGVEQPIISTTAQNKIKPVVTDTGLKVISMAFFLPDDGAPVVWRGPLKMRAITQFLADVDWGELDWLVIDAPPGTGDEPLSVAQMIPGAKALIVTTPQAVSAMDARRAIEFARLVGLQVVGVVENMSTFICPHCGKETELFPSGSAERMAQEMGVPILARIPFEPAVAIAGDDGRAVVISAPDGAVARAFHNLAARLIEQ
ncbi:MAG: Mrp/NBP35 family ATP-binding protein [candidate division WOR-3 bacterium]|jgi:Mrp family chromosome partitioning ATPase|nr:Mrp/NBP35 family ATP-binding protein [candidate division WOR-3 bacterium]MCR4424462.1 Mrp/NBP35 family ATP-binding protein [candidate division WOR-3 bacterium]MDH7519689.1 Mrp/NBP35 family ATP-binding protein [bacterium]